MDTVAAGAKAGITELWVVMSSSGLGRSCHDSNWRPGPVTKLHWWRFKNKFKLPLQLKDLAFDIYNRRILLFLRITALRNIKA